ncbi:MAG TPA: phage tail protein, partial [Pyrinomonadaceae bacterium]
MPPAILIPAAISAAFSAGQYAISYALAGSQKQPTQDNARTVDNRVQGSRYGQMIQRLYGTVETAGVVIWATDFRDDPTLIRGQRSKRGSTPDQLHHTYRRSFGIQVCAVPEGGAVLGVRRIKFDDKTFADAGPGLLATSGANYEIKLGAEDQLPNTWYEADKGVGRVSAHRGYVTLWFHDVDLEPFGDRIPNVRAEVVQAVDPALSDVVAAECRVAKLSAADIDVTELAGLAVSGYFVNTQGPVRASLEQLSSAFLFDGPEYDGKIHFRTRPRAAVATVAWDELGTAEGEESAGGDEPAPRLSVKRIQGAEIASEVSVSYFARSRDYEEGTQTFRRQNLTSGAPVTVTYNLVLEDSEALRLAKIRAVVGWAERLPGELALPPEFFAYVPGDVLRVPLDESGEEFIDFRIEKMNFSTPGVVRVAGRRQFQESYDQNGDEAGPGEAPPEPDPVTTPCPTRLWVNDRPPFRAGEMGRPGHYVAASPEEGCDPTAGGSWSGTGVVRDVDGAGDMRHHAVITEAATMGYALTALAGGAGLDTTHHVDVHLTSGQAASITDDAFEADRTLMLWAIGGETCQVRDVEDLGGGDYRLSHIRR